MPRAKTARNGKTEAPPPAGVSEVIVSSELKGNGAPFDLESEIRRRAYELYEERGRTPGHEGEDWIVAEREIIARYNHHNA